MLVDDRGEDELLVDWASDEVLVDSDALFVTSDELLLVKPALDDPAPKLLLLEERLFDADN